ncbi:MFS transporter [Leptolyngbya sp. AN03gr2]|uniref:MFS transporter n=1 Tax=unclassified Leptolyngbya TaxID=2650499 RepID=UPI003D31F153
MSQSFKKFGLLGSLYVAQYIPIAFFYQALPTFLRQQGASLEVIGMIGFLAVPWMLKFLWSPYIDRIRFRWGHYRIWILLFQSLLILNLILCAFLNLQQQLPVMLFCMLLICFFAASQDIATDALAIGLLNQNERGIGNGIQSGGNFLGSIIGGGILLILLDRLGWTVSILLLAGFMLLSLIPIMFHREVLLPLPAQLPGFSTLIQFFRCSGHWQWLLLLSLYMTGGSMASGMIRPLMVDRGFSLSDIGWILGVVSFSAGLVGSLIAGWLITRWGYKRSLIVFGLISTIAIATYFPIALGSSEQILVYGSNILVAIAGGMTFTATLAMMMNYSRLETAGTDYTIQVSVVYFSGILAMVLGGFLAQSCGYAAMFSISIGLTLISIILIARGILKYPALSELSNQDACTIEN